MLLSMTGFGDAKATYNDKSISIELRALNSKFLDLRFKLPLQYKSKETKLRQYVSERVSRGKIDISIDVKKDGSSEEYKLNTSLYKHYFNELKSLSNELSVPIGDITQSIIRIPNVVAVQDTTIEDKEYEVIYNTLLKAIDNFNSFRKKEGAVIEEDMVLRIKIIQECLTKVDPFEKERIKRIRTKLDQQLNEQFGRDLVDKNRFEQEVLYYLERIDITEEKVRLDQHCKYFLEELTNSTEQKGRKLGFISQEIGREINTLGAKAHSSDLQKIVVEMKDELEKIKEQIANTV